MSSFPVNLDLDQLPFPPPPPPIYRMSQRKPLALVSEADITLNELPESILTPPQWLHEMAVFNATPSTNIDILNNTASPTNCSVPTITRILSQYGQYNNYEKYNTMVINGYIRDIQQHIPSIVPSDINSICLSFYYEAENKYIHLLYQLYKITLQTTTTITRFSGVALVSMIKNNNLQTQDNEDVMDICNNLLQFNYIELVSLQTTFSALFEPSRPSKPSFNASQHYSYIIAPDIIDTIKQYSEQLTFSDSS